MPRQTGWCDEEAFLGMMGGMDGNQTNIVSPQNAQDNLGGQAQDQSQPPVQNPPNGQPAMTAEPTAAQPEPKDQVALPNQQPQSLLSQSPASSNQPDTQTSGGVPLSVQPPATAAIPAPAANQPTLSQGNPGNDQVNQAVGQVVQSGVLPQAPVSTPGVGSFHKEVLPAPQASERVPLVELREDEVVPEEVEGWLEKLEQAGEIKIPEAVKKDEQVLLDNVAPTRVQDTVVLPLSQAKAALAAKQKVTSSARWLYEWCKRLVKMLGERAKYREVSEEKASQ